jgi:hypothetical protein
MVREICEALEALSAQTPLIVILEDLHWADPSTLDVISALARRREPAKLLLIGTYRPVDVIVSESPLKALKKDLLVRHLCHEIAIERLEESDIEEYLAKEYADNCFPPGLANLIHHNSGGNALFMVAIVREIVKRGLIVQDRGTWTLSAPLQDIYPGIPETLQQMLEIQFKQLSVEEQRILQSCSVAGECWFGPSLRCWKPLRQQSKKRATSSRTEQLLVLGIHETPNGSFGSHELCTPPPMSSPKSPALIVTTGVWVSAEPICTAGKPSWPRSGSISKKDGITSRPRAA